MYTHLLPIKPKKNNHATWKSLKNVVFLLAYFPYFEQEVLGRTNRLLSLIPYGSHRKRRVQKFVYCCMCIRYRGNVSTEPLPSNEGIFTEPLPTKHRGDGNIQTAT
jgi:hypothetical protein